MSHIGTNLVGDWVRAFEAASLVREVALNNAYYLRLWYLNVWLTNTVTWLCDRNWLTERCIKRLINVLNKTSLIAMERVELKDYLISNTCYGWRDTTGSSKRYMIGIANLLNL